MTTASDALRPAQTSGFTLPRAAAVAVVLEALLILGLALGLASTKAQVPPDNPPIMLSFPAPPAPPVVKPKPKPKEPPKPVHRVTRRAAPQPRRVAISQDPAPMPKVTAPAPQETAPVPLVKPHPAVTGPVIPESFEDRVRAAVQDAVNYPFAARIAHLTGRAQVSFDYLDGRVSHIKIAQSSGSGVLDAAARQAVASAAYPPPPNELKGRSLPCEVWVRFFQSGVE